MKNERSQVWLTSFISIIIATFLTLLPSFRTAAQPKGKPATPENKNHKTSGNKSLTYGMGSKNADLDQNEIEKAMLEVEDVIRNFNGIEFPNIQQEMEAAMKAVDLANIQQQTQAAIQNIDMAEIQSSIQKAIKDADVAKIQRDAARELKTLQKEMAYIRKVDMEKLRLEMDVLKKELEKTKMNVHKQLAMAGEEMKNAREQLLLLKDGLDELEKDGLKKKNEKVNIEFKNGSMYLNGKSQTKQVSEKYKKYFDKSSLPIQRKTGAWDQDNDDNYLK